MSLPRHFRSALSEAVSQEAIRFQHTSPFFAELTAACERLMGHKEPADRKGEIAGLVKLFHKHTGLKVELELEENLVNAYVYPPTIDLNSPFLDRLRGLGFDKIEDYQDFLLTAPRLRQLCEELRGSVDLANGRVKGLFSQITSKMALGTGLWTKQSLTPDEVAAVILHELGHLFTFFECLMQTATTNMALAAATQALTKTDTVEHRLELIFETEKMLGVKIQDPQALAATDSKEVYEAVFIKATMDERLRTTHSASSTYDLRSAEFVADQFAVRYGAGRSLALAMSKLEFTPILRFSTLEFTPILRFSTPAGVFLQVLINLTAILAFVKMRLLATSLILLSLFGAISPEMRWCDGPVERIERMRRDTVQVLKSPHLPAEQREHLLKDIEALDNLLKNVTERRSFFNYLWIALTKHRREQFSQLRFQQDIEKLVNNEFFIKAQQLKTLA